MAFLPADFLTFRRAISYDLQATVVAAAAAAAAAATAAATAAAAAVAVATAVAAAAVIVDRNSFKLHPYAVACVSFGGRRGATARVYSPWVCVARLVFSVGLFISICKTQSQGCDFHG